MNRKSTTHAPRLCWLRGVLHAYYYEGKKRRRVSLGTTNMEVAKGRLASFTSPPMRETNRGTWLYFIQCDCPVGFVKIGTAANVLARMDELQTSCPYKIVLLRMVPSRPAIERATHKKFEHLRVRGEWFKPGGDLLAHIERLKEDDPLENTEEMTADDLNEVYGQFIDRSPECLTGERP